MPFVNDVVGKKKLGNIVDACFRIYGASGTADMLDGIKAQGFKYSTQSGISIGYMDMLIPESKKEMLDDAEAQVTASKPNSAAVSSPTMNAINSSSKFGQNAPTTSVTLCSPVSISSTPST